MPYPPQFDTPATTRWSTRTTEAIRAWRRFRRTSRARTLPMPISLPPSPMPTVTGRRRPVFPTNNSSTGALSAATLSPRAER